MNQSFSLKIEWMLLQKQTCLFCMLQNQFLFLQARQSLDLSLFSHGITFRFKALCINNFFWRKGMRVVRCFSLMMRFHSLHKIIGPASIIVLIAAHKHVYDIFFHIFMIAHSKKEVFLFLNQLNHSIPCFVADNAIGI